MMRRRGPKGNKSRLLFSINTFMATSAGVAATVDPGPGGAPQTFWFTRLPVMQAGRVNWLCQQRNKSHLTVTGMLMWLDFVWQQPVSGSASGIADTELYLCPYSEDANGLASQFFLPFDMPLAPSQVSNWDTTDDAWAGDPIMWRHYVKGIVNGTGPTTTYTGSTGTYGQAGYNCYTGMAANAGTGPFYLKREFEVRQNWQPDVRVKTRRRLARDMGIEMGMLQRQSTAPAIPIQLFMKVLTYGY